MTQAYPLQQIATEKLDMQHAALKVLSLPGMDVRQEASRHGLTTSNDTKITGEGQGEPGGLSLKPCPRMRQDW